MKIKVQAHDPNDMCGHDCLFIFHKPKKIEYTNTSNIHLYIDEEIIKEKSGVPREKSFALLLEPRDIKPHLYNLIIYNKKYMIENFNKIITNDDEILSWGNEFSACLPFTGGSWILEKDSKIHKKEKLVSIVASNKRQTYGHQLRHAIIGKHRNKLDAFGHEYIHLLDDYKDTDDSTIEGQYNKITGNLARAFAPYMFCVVIENTKNKRYFSEKLLNCFATGAVPIYYGGTEHPFEEEGIIRIETIEDFDNIIDTLNEELYLSKLEHIYKNYTLHKNFVSYDDAIADIIMENINEYMLSNL